MSEEIQKRWPEISLETKREFFFASDRAAIDLGIAGLNAITLLNGGAIVALMAFAAQVWDDKNGSLLVKNILSAGQPFAWGICASALSFFVAYFYQSSVTLVANKHLGGHFSSPEQLLQDLRTPQRAREALRLFMVLSAFLAVCFFVYGTIQVLHTFSQTITSVRISGK